MTWIRIDPTELDATAATLRTLAAETADVGRGVPSCVECTMPPEIDSVVRQIATTTAAILGTIAERIGVEASDLQRRAGLAASDSLATAASAASGGDPLAGMTGFVGGSSLGTITISDTGLLGEAMGIIGGNAPTLVTVDAGAGLGWGSAIIGGGNPNLVSTEISFGHSDPFGLEAMAAFTQRKSESVRAGINALAGRPLDPVSAQMLRNLSNNAGNATTILTAESRSEMEARTGRSISLGEWERIGNGGSDSTGIPSISNPFAGVLTAMGLAGLEAR